MPAIPFVGNSHRCRFLLSISITVLLKYDWLKRPPMDLDRHGRPFYFSISPPVEFALYS